jgi:PAS domain S-box-containing protein
MFSRQEPQPRYVVVIESGPDKGKSFFIGEKVLVGRDQDIEVPLSDLQVSRRHLELQVGMDDVLIKDLGSSNGTIVKGKKVTSLRIPFNTQVHIGQTCFSVFSEQAANEQVAGESTEKVVLFSDEPVPKDVTMISCADPKVELSYEKGRLIKLLDLSNRINASLNLREILESMMKSIFEIFPATEKAVLFLTDSEGGMNPAAIKVKDEGCGQIRLSRTIVEKIKEKKSAILSGNIMADSEYKLSESLILNKVVSFMCAPLYIKENLLGIFYLDIIQINGSFTEGDLRFFLMMCNQLAMSVYNARLYSEILDLAHYNTNILASIASGIIVVDNEGVIKTFNAMAEKIFGMLPGDVLEKNISEVAKLKVVEEALNRTIEGGQAATRTEIKFTDEKENEKTIGLWTSLLKDHTHFIKGVIAIFEDLTEINQLNHLLQRSERLAALGEMAAGVAHEIRNPLNSIRGFAQLFGEGMVPQEQMKECTGIIIKEVDRLNRLVVDLLDFSKEQKIVKKTVDICSLVSSTAAYVREGAKERKVAWETAFKEERMEIDVDSDKIKQVLINLYQNALDAFQSDEGKFIKTGIRLPAEEKDMIVIAIEDNGTGISESGLKKIFNPFYSTKKKGSGLGLSICQRIIEEHGGFITVKSAEGKGTVFYLHLPVK